MIATTIPTQNYRLGQPVDSSGAAKPIIRPGDRILCWFSCGAASAVATKLTLEIFGAAGPFDWRNEVIPVYCDTSLSEHPDNERFISDCERWFGMPITRIKHPEFSTVDEVFESKRYMSGIAGACCTSALKKVPRLAFSKPSDIHVFGYTDDKKERKRAVDFEARNFELKLLWILQLEHITKQMCLDRLMQAGIEIPAMYKLDYDHNNCIACAKATSAYYWDKTRTDFPEVFARRAKQSREIGCRLVRVKGKRMFLDELPPGPYKKRRENLSCGPECGRK